MSEHSDKIIYDIAYQRGRADEREALARGDSGTRQVRRCQERHPEGGQCELRDGHTFDRHLAGMILWPTEAANGDSAIQSSAQSDLPQKGVAMPDESPLFCQKPSSTKEVFSTTEEDAT